MTTESDFKRFLTIGSIVVAAGVIASVALVAVIDPYRLYGMKEVAGVNQVKPLPTRYQNQIKMHGALKHGADTFILGNSRAELGLNPEHRALGDSAFNLALAGTSMNTGREQLEQLQAEGIKPKRLIVGVEFLDFLVDPNRTRPVREPKPAGPLDELAWQADSLFSIDSLADSLKTLRLQRDADPQSITARGFNPLLEYNKFARDDGYYSIFQQRAVENAKRFVRLPRGLVNQQTGSSPNLDELRAVLAHGVRNQADLHLVIYPYHAQILAMFDEAGLASTFDNWKGMLVEELEKVRTANPGARVTLWDFSGYSSYQCEAIPAKGDKKTKTTWYWEAGHFKPALGDLMLSRIAGQADAPSSFGFALDQASIGANNARLASERASCAATQPDIFEHARALVSKARGATGI